VQCAGTRLASPLGRPVKPVSPGQPDEDPTNAHPRRTRRSRRTLQCSRVGRPPRTSLNAIEMKEEQQIRTGRARVRKKAKEKR
jgi:hypothetical protein